MRPKPLGGVFRSVTLAALAAFAAPASASVLVNLDATGLSPGTAMPTWANSGTLGGSFASSGAVVPNIATVGSVNCVPLTASSYFSGLAAPGSIGTNSMSRTIEVWAYNPTVEAEETLVAWSRRGGPDGTNWSFNYGSNLTYGALGGWGAFDVGWGTVPAAAQWHHLVITFDGNIVRTYADGVQSNSKTTGGYNLYTVRSDGTTPLSIVIGGQNNNAVPFAPLVFNSGINIAKVKVHDAVLSPTQVFASFSADATTFGKSTALAPKILGFSANTTVYMAGQPLTLSYENNLADTVTISDGVTTLFTASGASALKGTATVVPTAATTYTLTATNTSGSVTSTVAVTPFTPVGLVHRWSFNESNAGGAADTAVIDSVGASHGVSVGAQNGVIRGTYNATVGTASAWTRSNDVGSVAGTQAIRLGGGASASSAYIDLPNNVMSGLTQVTFEGWMTLNGAQNWSRYFDFGTNTGGEQNAPGGSFNGSEYMLISAQIGGTTTSRRMSIMDNGVENLFDVTSDPVTYGTQFHFAAVYDATGNGGATPAFKYYKNGTLMGTLNTNYRPQDLVFVNNWLGRSNWAGDANTNGTYNEFRLWGIPMSTTMINASIAAGPDGAPPAVPMSIAAFSAFPAIAAPGQPVKLSWVVTPGTGSPTVSINNGATVSNPTSYFDFTTVSPPATTTYTLTAVDGANTVTKTVTVTVAGSAPVAQTDSVTTRYQTAVALKLLATDADTAQSALTYTVTTPPTNGALTGTAPNLTYTPNAGFSGPDSFAWKANDGSADSNIAAFTVTVNPAPAPVGAIALSETAFRTDYGVGSFAGRLQASDANPDDSFTYTLVSGAGSTHNGYFTIVGNQLIANHDFSADLNQTISLRVKVTDSTGNSFETVLTRNVDAADLHVKINEIYYNSPRNTVPCEFIELYNPFNTPVNVGGWRIANGVDYTFPGGTSIPANGYLVIAQNPSVIQSLYGVTALGPWTGGLSSDGETVEIRDSGNTKVDEVAYGINSPWPVPANGDGPSLELINPGLDNDIGGHWRASTAPAGTADFIAANQPWRYRPGNSEASTPVDAWRATAFTEDATWKTGTAPIGLFKINSATATATHPESGVTLNTQLTAATTGLPADMATYVGAGTNVLTNFTVAYPSVYFRKAFTVSGPIPKALYLRVMHNDAAIVWINGVEVARFGFDPSKATGDIPFNSSAYYERGNDPWSDKAILNTDAFLVAGNNVLTIQGFAKIPVLRAAPDNQDVAANYNIFDFAVDAVLRPLSENSGTPGAQNSVFATNAPPAVRNVDHQPNTPRSNQSVLITARLSDRQGIGSAALSYQVVAPGAYLPATSTLGLDALGLNIVNNRSIENAPNPAFEDPANWTTVPMVDDGSVSGDIAGDGIFSARIPAQPHRTLVRYRISATDLLGASVRVPLADDPSKNFAYYVYDGVPAYQTATGSFSPASLESLPVYQWIMRNEDFTAMNAYTANYQVSLGNTNDLLILLARRFYNFEGAMVYDGKVYDHTEVRLRGGNSRYNGVGKRHYRFKFPKGYAFEARDNKGRRYARDWEDMLFNKLYGNKGAYDFGLTYSVGAKLWENMGVPMPKNHWVHFRVVRGANEAPDPTNGDFYGLYQALELPDGKNFLKARDLPPGNFYKMSDWIQNGEMDERYQAAGSVDYAEDFDNIRYNAHPQATQSWMETNIDMPNWYSYRTIQEAIRHYDIFIEPTGRHRIKNLYWYFRPSANPNGLGQLVQMPYDWDASFGPNYNNGNEFISNALHIQNSVYTAAPVAFIDSPTWVTGGALPNQTPMRIALRNRIREARDLMIYRDGTGSGPADKIIDDALSVINAFYPADMARWPGNTGAVGHWAGGAAAKAQDMKNFLFTGWTDAFGADPAIGAGGRASFLDTISDNTAYNATTGDGDSGRLPSKPTIAYSGAPGFPLDALAFTSGAFSDPQGSGDFGAYQWRIGEVTDPTAPAYNAAADRLYEMVDIWRSAEVTNSATTSVVIPGTVLRQGHAYRARVRHKDITGRYSHWSDPIQFVAGEPNALALLGSTLVVSEVMYKPAPRSEAEKNAGFVDSDFEFIEILNISPTLTLDLTNVRFTKGVDFDFANGSITSLAPGGRALIVANLAAFTMRYGSGKPVAGVWDLGQNLANSGEEVKLSYGLGAAIRDFVYDDATPWPDAADNGGVSLVLIDPPSNPDHALPTSWRASYITGGTPGGREVQTLAEWLADNGQVSPSADPNADGFDNCLTFALGHDLRPFTIVPGQIALAGQTYLSFDYTRRVGVTDSTYAPEVSTNLGTWDNAAAATVWLSTVDNGDGTETVSVRTAAPIDTTQRHFLRVRVVHP